MPKIRTVFLVLLLVVTSHTFLVAQSFSKEVNGFIQYQQGTIVITDVKVIDGSGSAAKEHQWVLIEKDRIDAIGKSTEIKIPAGATVIDGVGKTIIPGLVMLHEHLYYTSLLETFFNIEQMPYTFPRMYLAAGVTTARTAGSIEPQTDLNIKRLIAEGKMTGPDFDVTAPYIERPGFDIPALNTIKDTAEAAASVAFWSAKGCTSFKMYMHATKEDLAVVVRETHKRGLKVTGHIGAITYREAATLGIDDLEHGFMASTDFVTDKKENELPAGSRRSLMALDANSAQMKDLIQFLISKKVALTSTLPVFEPYTGREIVHGGGIDALIPQVKEDLIKEWQGMQNKDSASLALFKKELYWEKKFYDAGGLLVAGTDPTGAGRTIAGYSNYRQIELMVEAGFTPLQAIKICTLNGAIYLNRSKDIGTIEKGKKADLVLIDGDIEKNIQDIRKTMTVFKNGTGFDSQKMFASVKGKVGLY